MLLQWRDAPAPRLGRAAASLAKALDPDDRCAGADLKLFGYLAPRSSALHLRYHSFPHVPRIGLRHRPASQKRINADRLSHPWSAENPRSTRGGTCSSCHAVAGSQCRWYHSRREECSCLARSDAATPIARWSANAWVGVASPFWE